MAANERTIILHAEQVRALRAGATQIRVPIKPQPAESARHASRGARDGDPRTWCFWPNEPRIITAPCAPGTVLRVREPWRVVSWELDAKFEVVIEYSDGYKHECAHDDVERIIDQSERELQPDPEDERYLIGECRWRSAATMPAWAARMWLTVVEVQAERDGDGWAWVLTVRQKEGRNAEY